MEKGEHDFKYKVDQAQESLADAHKAHLRQVCPSLPFNTHPLPFAYSSLPTEEPLLCILCLVAPLPFNSHALPSAYPSAHWMPLLCLLCLVAPLPFNTHALPSAYPSAHWMPLMCLLCLVAAQVLPPSGCQILVCISACCIKTQLEGMAVAVLYIA